MRAELPRAVDEAELAVLGTVFATSGDCLDDLGLAESDFYEPARGDLFTAMLALRAAGKPVEPIILSEANPDSAVFVWSVADWATSAASVGYYADIVRKHALRRRLSVLGSTFAALDDVLDTQELGDRARALLDAAIGTSTSRVQFVADILPSVVERLTAHDVFVPSPWPSLDQKIGGFRRGAVYVIAARPGVGKTVIAAQVAARLAEGGNVAFASLEMTQEELVARLLSERLMIGVGKVKDARLTEHDWRVLADRRHELEALRIAIDDRSGVSAGDVRGFARAVAREGALAGIVVDYMQLMVSRQKMDRHLQVADFSRQLKIAAKEMQVPVIALSQLNRNSEATNLAIPKLSDLRESGAIEQDADVVMLLRREGEFPNESLIIDVAKNRHGETGEVRLAWEGMFSRAVEWAEEGAAR